MKSVLITGANTGLGKETAARMAERSDVNHVLITARSAERGTQALEDLQKRVGSGAKFSLLSLDTSNRASVARLADSIEQVDIAILNAGGVTGRSAFEVGAYGVTEIMAANVAGHVDLVERMLAAGKITDTIALVSSEAARGIKAMGVKPPAVDTSDVTAVQAVMTGNDPATRKNLLYMYANVKMFGSLWAAGAARRHGDVKIVSVSPGSTRGTEGATHMPFPMNRVMPVLMRFVMPVFKASHGLEAGAQRYVEVVTNGALQTGGFYASPKGKISGPLTDQRLDHPNFASIEDQDAVTEALQSLTGVGARSESSRER